MDLPRLQALAQPPEPDAAAKPKTKRKTSRRLKHKISPADERALVEEYLRGSTVARLARQHGISEYSVRMILSRAGELRSTHGLTPGQVAVAHQLLNTGHSINHISQSMAVPDSTLRLVLGRPPA